MRTTRRLVLVPLAAIAIGSFLTGDVGARSVKAGEPEPVDRSGSELPAARKTSLLRGVPCSRTPVPAAGEPAPVGPGPCPGTRPGGRVVTKIGDCTLNFLFRAPEGARYIGTAGHCVGAGDDYTFDSHGNAHFESVWAQGTGPVAMDPTGHRFGEFAYVVKDEPKDFALIRLDPGVPASPEMCHFGVPRGFYSTNTMRAVSLRYYGNGEGISDVTPARSAMALGTPDPDHLYAIGLAVPGDSGAGVMTADGLAVGVLVTTGYQLRDFGEPPASTEGLDVGTMGITRLEPQLARASEKLGVTLELVTAARRDRRPDEELTADGQRWIEPSLPEGRRLRGPGRFLLNGGHWSTGGTGPGPRRPFALARMSLNQPERFLAKTMPLYARRGESSPLLFKTPMSAA